MLAFHHSPVKLCHGENQLEHPKSLCHGEIAASMCLTTSSESHFLEYWTYAGCWN